MKLKEKIFIKNKALEVFYDTNFSKQQFDILDPASIQKPCGFWVRDDNWGVLY